MDGWIPESDLFLEARMLGCIFLAENECLVSSLQSSVATSLLASYPRSSKEEFLSLWMSGLRTGLSRSSHVCRKASLQLRVMTRLVSVDCDVG